MNVLILGSGGREHAFSWKIAQSPQCDKLYIAPGNAGTAAIGENVNIGVNDFDAIGDFVKNNQVDRVVVGPVDPLVNGISDYFNATKAYMQSDRSTKHLPYEATNGLFDGSKTLYINVDDEKGIRDAINFKIENNIKHVVIVGAREAYKVSSLLKENDIAVLLMRVHSRPNLEDSDYDLPYKMAKLLVDEGVLVALEASGQMERMNARNLPFYAGTTVAHGLTKEQALQLITLNPAKILGIDKSYGTLEKGKSATLFISEGDALDMRSNNISHAFIDGRELSLETHQTELWKRYSEKYKNQ